MICITDRITCVILAHLQCTGRTPTTIYLGRKEYAELKAYALDVAGFTMSDAEGAKRTEYQGHSIYRVDAESYLAVGVGEVE